MCIRDRARVVLDVNKSERHIRGGLATREKYQHRLAICSKKAVSYTHLDVYKRQDMIHTTTATIPTTIMISSNGSK